MLILVATVLVVVVLSATLQRLARSEARPAREDATHRALVQAKQALLGYAATYRDFHAGEAPGYLLCPDTDNDGSAEPSCGSTGESIIGRLPFRTLGVPDLRDANGECLWYAVSGTFKNNPKTNFMNWDAQGQFGITGAQGETLAATGGAVAVVFAPGQVIGAQARSVTLGGACQGPIDFRAYLDVAYAFPNSGMVTLTQGSPGSTSNNDRLMWLAPKEIFVAIKRRGDFNGPSGDINTLIDKAANCLATAGFPSPQNATIVGAKDAGRAPLCLDAADPHKEYERNWQDQIWYAVCTAAAPCLTVNSVACRAAVVFSGEAGAGQSRVTASQKLDPSNYLEEPNLSAFRSAATVIAGAASFQVADPRIAATQDVVRCMN